MPRIPKQELDDLKRTIPLPSCDGDADAGERCRPEMDPGDAGSPQCGVHANLYPGEYPGVTGGTCQYASGGAA